MKNYGTNNVNAYRDICEITGTKHKWSWVRKVGRCTHEYKCDYCASLVVEDSSD